MKRLIPLAVAVPLAVAGCSSSKTSSTSSTTTAGTSASTSAGTTPTTAALTTPETITEAGSTLLYPFLQEIAPGLHSAYPEITLTPGQGGSGTGITDALNGTTDLGGSDAYLSPSQLQMPGVMNIPIAISSQSVDYNLPGVKNLKLTGDVLAKIYEGQITSWDDPAIAALNSGVTLPHETIVPVHRSDGSGDTFLFTSFLSATNTSWANSVSYNTKVNWPNVASAKTATGNPGMVQACQATPGCVAYVGISAQHLADSDGLGQAELQNKDGNFVLPTSDTVQAAVNAGAGNLPSNLAASLIYEPGANSYPIVNFEYIIVKKNQSDPNKATAIRDFFTYATDPNGGSSPANLAQEQFEALPPAVRTQVLQAVAEIQ